MDLASDGYGAEKFGGDEMDESARNANGFTFPREGEGTPKEDRPAEARTNRPVDPMSRPVDPMNRPADPMSRSVDPMKRAADPTNRPGDPMSRAADPMSRSGDPMGRTGDPMSRATDPICRTAAERRHPRTPPRPPVSAAATLPPVPTIPAPPPIPPASSTDYDWFRPQVGSPAEHPLVRGLMLELPPRTEPLDKAWLDQWLEAARAALELIYSRTDGPSPRQ